MRFATVIAVDLSEVYKLERKHFIKAMTPYPELLIKIEKLALERYAEMSREFG